VNGVLNVICHSNRKNFDLWSSERIRNQSIDSQTPNIPLLFFLIKLRREWSFIWFYFVSHVCTRTIASGNWAIQYLFLERKKKPSNLFDFGFWLLWQVVVSAELIEHYDISGLYILRPSAVEIWETLKVCFSMIWIYLWILYLFYTLD